MGLLGVVTSDAFGNLASDNGALYKEVARVKSGTAVAMALADPSSRVRRDLGSDQLGRFRWSQCGVPGVSTVGVHRQATLFLQGDRLTITGAAGWGRGNRSQATVPAWPAVAREFS